MGWHLVLHRYSQMRRRSLTIMPVFAGVGRYFQSTEMLISPRLQRSVFTTAFVTCGLVTLLVGGAFNYVMFLWAKHAVDLKLSLVLTLIGVLVLAIAFLPDDWPRGDTGGSSRRRLSFRFLLGFAGLGFVLGLFVTLSPPRT